MDLPPGGSGQTVDMTQKNSQAFDSGLGSGTALVQGANNRSLREVEEELEAMRVKVKQLEEKLAIEKENSKDVTRQLGVQIEDLHKKLAKKEAEVKELKKQLISDEKVHEDNEKKSAKEIEELRQENSRLEKKTVDMTQKNSQAFDSGLGSGTALVQGANNRSLREVEEDLASKLAAIKLDEPNDQQNNELHLENHRLKDKLSSTEKKHEKELNRIKRQIGTQIEDVHKKLANEKAQNKLLEEQLANEKAKNKLLEEQNDQQNNEFHLENHRLKDKLSSTEKKHEKELNWIKRQIGTQIEDVHKKLANEKAKNKLLEEQLANEKAKNKLLEEQLANEKAKNKLLEEQLANGEEKNKLLEEQTAEQRKTCNILVRSTQPEPGYIAIMLDPYVRSTDPMVYRYAYFRLLNAFKEHAPERPFPSQDDLTCLQVGWKGSYVNTELPCAIQTLRDWYRVSIGDIPYAFYGFIPGIHRNVSHEFIRKYFYVLHSLKFEERGQLKGALHEEKYVLCCEENYGDGHMRVVTRSYLEKMIDDQASSTKTHFYICLPRGTSSVDPCDAWYTYKTFQSLEELTRLQLTENEYMVKVTTSKGDDECFPWKRGNEGYYTEWSPNNQVNYTTGKLYVKKGLFPFIKQPRML